MVPGYIMINRTVLLFDTIVAKNPLKLLDPECDPECDQKSHRLLQKMSSKSVYNFSRYFTDRQKVRQMQNIKHYLLSLVKVKK